MENNFLIYKYMDTFDNTFMANNPNFEHFSVETFAPFNTELYNHSEQFDAVGDVPTTTDESATSGKETTGKAVATKEATEEKPSAKKVVAHKKKHGYGIFLSDYDLQILLILIGLGGVFFAVYFVSRKKNKH